MEKTVIALGFFDSIHKGHLEVIKKAQELKGNNTLAVFTFINDLDKVLTSSNGVVFTYSERVEILKSLGVDKVLGVEFDDKLKNLTPKAFLDGLKNDYNACAFVCGKDFRFGKNAQGDADFLIEYAKSNGLGYSVVPLLFCNDKKISTTKIKELLKAGNVKQANELLTKNYFILGTVFEDRKIGTKLGFPTVNVKIDGEKLRLKYAVYKGYAIIDGVKYNAVINYGARPTFNLDGVLVEAHLIGFSGILYGQDITLYFTDYLRDIKKFDNTDELCAQLKKDVESAR